MSEWTQAQQTSLVNKVALLVPSSGDVKIRLLRWSAEPRSGRLMVELAANETTLVEGVHPSTKMLSGSSVVAARCAPTSAPNCLPWTTP